MIPVASADYISNFYEPPQILLELEHLTNCVILAVVENDLLCIIISTMSLAHVTYTYVAILGFLFDTVIRYHWTYTVLMHLQPELQKSYLREKNI